MCGIIGYTGPRLNARTVLLDGLKRLEYRGYDSAGVALLEDDHSLKVYKKAGKVVDLEMAIKDVHSKATCGIGHTRWATHGGVSDTNAHPHKAGQVALIHNGIIENYQFLIDAYHLKDKLISQTDTEVAAWVLSSLYHGDPIETIRAAMKQFVGSFSFCILFEDHPEKIYAIRNVSPLVATYTNEGAFVASDLTALIPYSHTYFVVPEYHILTLTKNDITVEDLAGNLYLPEYLTVNWNVEDAQKNGYPHYMIKEIMEQPEKLTATISARISQDHLPDLTVDQIPDNLLTQFDRIQVIACGTAMHAGMVFKSLAEPLLHTPMTVSIASEYRYEIPMVDENSLVIAISQSGETIDTLEALRLSKSYGAKVLSIVNTKGSTIARESDYVMYMYAGPEIAVASTKAYTSQIMTLYILTCRMALVRGILPQAGAQAFMEHLYQVVEQMALTLENAPQIESYAEALLPADSAFFIGRGLDYSLSLEGALKLKEISYIHAEAYAAGELKHGTIALVTDGVPVIALATQERIYSKTISNIREVKARNAFVILITKVSAPVAKDLYDIHLTIPDTEDAYTPFCTAALLQLLAYYVSARKGLDVDMPRNLAKSVTVE